MKKKLVVLAVVSAMAGAAHAEDKLFEVYGILDIAYGNQSSGLEASRYIGSSINSSTFFSTTNPNVGSHSGLWSGGLSQDRIGVKGSKSFENGLRLGYLLETGFNIVGGQLIDANHQMASNRGTSSYSISASNSSQNGQIFNREAYGKIGYGNFGDLQIGRNQTLIADALSGTAPLQNSGIFSYTGASGAFGGGSGISETQRLDQSVKYLNKFGDFNVGLMYARGDGSALTDKGNMWGAALGYKAKGLIVRLAYSDQKDALKQGIDTTANTSYDVRGVVYDAKGLMLAGSYEINAAWKVNAGYSQFTMSKPTDTSPAVTGAYSNSVRGSFYAGSDQKAYLTWIGADYKATDKLKISAAYHRAHYDGYCNSASCTAAQMRTDSDVDWVGLVVDYDIYKDVDIYAAAADIRISNTGASNAITGSVISSHNTLLAAGIRYKF